MSRWHYLPLVPNKQVCSAYSVVLMSVPALAHTVLYQTPGHPFHLKLSKPTHPTLSLCRLAQVLKYQAVTAEAFSMCPNPRATSCMKSPSLRKHPSHSRHSLILHRKLSGCMHVHTHVVPACISYKVFKTWDQQCVFMLMYLSFLYLCGITDWNYDIRLLICPECIMPYAQ